MRVHFQQFILVAVNAVSPNWHEDVMATQHPEALVTIQIKDDTFYQGCCRTLLPHQAWLIPSDNPPTAQTLSPDVLTKERDWQDACVAIFGPEITLPYVLAGAIWLHRHLDEYCRILKLGRPLEAKVSIAQSMSSALRGLATTRSRQTTIEESLLLPIPSQYHALLDAANIRCPVRDRRTAAKVILEKYMRRSQQS